jgi:hypothetical protein
MRGFQLFSIWLIKSNLQEKAKGDVRLIISGFFKFVKFNTVKNAIFLIKGNLILKYRIIS